MTRLIQRTGDLFTSGHRAIGQGVNVDGVMGSGIAVLFRNRWPDMYQDYRKLCLSRGLQAGDVHVYPVDDPDFDLVLNIASQDRPGKNARLTWLRDGTFKALSITRVHGHATLALPRIGAGVGGLDRGAAEDVLREVAEASSVDIELWTYPS